MQHYAYGAQTVYALSKLGGVSMAVITQTHIEFITRLICTHKQCLQYST